MISPQNNNNELDRSMVLASRKFDNGKALMIQGYKPSFSGSTDSEELIWGGDSYPSTTPSNGKLRAVSTNSSDTNTVLKLTYLDADYNENYGYASIDGTTDVYFKDEVGGDDLTDVVKINDVTVESSTGTYAEAEFNITDSGSTNFGKIAEGANYSIFNAKYTVPVRKEFYPTSLIVAYDPGGTNPAATERAMITIRKEGADGLKKRALFVVMSEEEKSKELDLTKCYGKVDQKETIWVDVEDSDTDGIAIRCTLAGALVNSSEISNA